MFTRKALFIALCAALGMLAWNTVAAQERATLQVSGERDDYYARVWVVDAKPYLWIRAETPTRHWLEPLRQYPNVYLWRGDQRLMLRAVIWDDHTSDAHAYVDPLFREKYGLFDEIRGFFRTTPTVLIRLEPR